MKRYFVAIVLVLLTGSAFATTPGGAGWARVNDRGDLDVTLTFSVGNGCYSAGTVRPGAPEGSSEILNTVPVTFFIAHSGQDFCFQSFHDITWRTVVSRGMPENFAVIAYLVDEQSGELVSEIALKVVED